VKLLLDTHIWVWSLVDPGRLSNKIKRELARSNVELWLSPVSVWEAHMAVEKKSIRTKLSPHEWVRDALAAAPIQSAPLTHEVAIESRRLNLDHQDPGDRFIAATAVVYGLTLATVDERLLAGNGYKVLGP
jgi:PIN domain nuclease of toxin-antitoxin system